MNRYYAITVAMTAVMVTTTYAKSTLQEIRESLWQPYHDNVYAPPDMDLLLKPAVYTRGLFSDVNDTSEDVHIFSSNYLPEEHLLPYVGNGHIATVVYGGNLYLNGLYSGAGSESHRARIQNFHASNFSIEGDLNANRTYSLDTKKGIWTETINGSNIAVEHKVYAHQKYTRVLVTELTITRLSSSDTTQYKVLRDNLTDTTNTADIEYQLGWNNQIYSDTNQCDTDGSCRRSEGKIETSEVSGGEKTTMFLYYNEIEAEYTSNSGDQPKHYVYFLSVDKVNDTAKKEFDDNVVKTSEANLETMYNEHVDGWQDIWEEGSVEVTGNLSMAKAAYGSLYYLYSSLPAMNPYQTNSKFYGLSSCSLSRGNESLDYNGHVTWDQEIWMLPPLLMFRSEPIKQMLNYRIHTMTEALRTAVQGGLAGTQFPWESAYTGIDVTPSTCKDCSDQKDHITGHISFAGRQYISASGDSTWLTELQNGTDGTRGVDFLREMGHFWYSRPDYNLTKDRYVINDIMGPDMHHTDVNNSVITNVLAALSVYTARYAACLAKLDEEQEVPDRWIKVVRELLFPFNEDEGIHEQFEDFPDIYSSSNKIGEADAVLLGFPYMWDMPSGVRENDLKYYEDKTDELAPGTTWAMYAIGYMERGNTEEADRLFNKSYAPYVTQPFKVGFGYVVARGDLNIYFHPLEVVGRGSDTPLQVWTERPDGSGAVNYLPGQAGFLQSLLFGYGGLRLEPEQLSFFKPYLPQNTTGLDFVSIDYLSNKINYNLTEDNITLKCTVCSNAHKLTVYYGSEEKELTGTDMTFSLQSFTIKSGSSSGCDLPIDEIDHEYGDRWTSGSAQTVATLSTLLMATLIGLTL